MNQTHYPFRYAEQENIFRFISVGRHGRVEKVVRFGLLYEEVYNLGFGDYDEQTGVINDITVTDNGDMSTVMSTVIMIIRYFFELNPDRKVFLTGSSASRTRLYQIIINLNLEDIRKEFEVYGYRNEQWLKFRRNEYYESFLIIKL